MLTFPEHLIPQVFGLDSCCSFAFPLVVTCGAGTAYPTMAPEFFLFVLFLLAIVLSILRFTASDCPFRIFKNFSVQYNVFVNCVCPYPFLPWFCLFPLN